MSFKTNIGKPPVAPGPGQCEMIDVHHPDCECGSCGAMPDVQCLEPYVGTVHGTPGIRVCGACAVQMESEGFLVDYRPETRFVIVHPEMGIYLGSAMGLGFWSKLDPVGQRTACTSPSRGNAERWMSEWEGGCPAGVVTWPVIADEVLQGAERHGPVYASVAACVAAGLEVWDPEAKPTVTQRDR